MTPGKLISVSVVTESSFPSPNMSSLSLLSKTTCVSFTVRTISLSSRVEEVGLGGSKEYLRGAARQDTSRSVIGRAAEGEQLQGFENDQ